MFNTKKYSENKVKTLNITRELVLTPTPLYE